MRRHDPGGRTFGPDAYVFGDPLGRRVKSVQGAWVKAAAKAGLKDFQLRDLRHEAGSRFDEAGMPIVYVSTMLGHSNLSTTSRYLNINRRGLHLAMRKFEESRMASLPAATRTPADTGNEAKSDSVVQPLYKNADSSLAAVQHPSGSSPAKTTLQ
jgi:hypothetical protein